MANNTRPENLQARRDQVQLARIKAQDLVQQLQTVFQAVTPEEFDSTFQIALNTALDLQTTLLDTYNEFVIPLSIVNTR
jgi:hypothetical protein